MPVTMARTTLLKLDPKGRTELPEEVRVALGVELHDFILLGPTERGTFELLPTARVPKDQLWFYHPDMQARVAQAERDFAEDRSTRTQTPEEAQALLDGLKQQCRSRFVVDDAGNRVAVLLEIKEYQSMLEQLEELESLRAYDLAKASGEKAILFEQAVQEIERDRS